MTFAAVVLAAGGGSRFRDANGEPASTHKLLAPLRGQSVLHWAVTAANVILRTRSRALLGLRWSGLGACP